MQSTGSLAGFSYLESSKAENPLVFPPHHLVDDAGVALDDLDHLGGDGLVGIVGNGSLGQRTLGVELDGGVDGLQ